MAGLRFTLDLFIPEVSSGTNVAGIKIPTALANQIPTIRQGVQNLKTYAKKINAGQPNEEMTVKATFHVCYHDEATPKPCGLEQEI